jgi:hypothetical protein
MTFWKIISNATIGGKPRKEQNQRGRKGQDDAGSNSIHFLVGLYLVYPPIIPWK